MIIEPKAGPSITSPAGTQTTTSSEARAKAIAMLTGGNSTPEAAANIPAATDPVDAVRQTNIVEGTSEESVSPLSTPEEPKAVAAEPEKPLSSEYAILARKEKVLRARDAQLRQREAAIKAAEDAKQAAQRPVIDESQYISKSKLQQDLFGTLAEMGLTYDQITQQAVNAPTPEKVALDQELKAMREELKALKGEQDNTKKSWEEQQQQSYKQAVAQIKSEASSLITHNPAFETIKETGSVDDVVELIERTFREDGTLMTVEEAAQQVEDYLVEEALKIARIKKIQQRLQPAAPAAQAPKPTSQPQQPQMKTLTNQVSSTKQLSVRERAILAAQGKLNK